MKQKSTWLKTFRKQGVFGKIEIEQKGAKM